MKGRAWLASWLALCGCAGHGADVGQSMQAVSGGTFDTEHDSVFLVVEHAPPFFDTCSATLIAPNLLLTAHHCVVGNTGGGAVQCGVTAWGAPISPSAFEVTNAASTDPDAGGVIAAYGALAIDVPPGGDGCGFDLALITLDQALPASVALPAVPRLEQQVVQGERYTAVGYGQDLAGNGAGNRHELAGQSVVCAPGTCNALAAASEFIGGDGVCEGDSGSPALDANGLVIGVDSRGHQDCTSPIYGSVAAWKSWIVSVTQAAAQAGSYAPPAWASGPGSAGSGGTASEQGRACMQQSECSAGFHCWSPTGQASNAFCAADCTSSVCGDGLSCDSGSHVCIPSAAGAVHGSGSCALGGAPRREPSWAALALTALAVFVRRRARRR